MAKKPARKESKKEVIVQAPKAQPQKVADVSDDYSVYTKKVVWLEWVSIALIWLLFIAGLGMVFYFRGVPQDSMGMYSAIIMMAILFMSLVPFIANWEYYTAIWKAWRDGREIIYKSADDKTPHSVLGNRPVWIRK